MLRIEVAIPLLDKHQNEVNPGELWSVIKEIGDFCNGYSLYLRQGLYTPSQGEPYPEMAWFLTTDISLEKMVWFLTKKSEWKDRLNQEKMYIALSVVDHL